MIPYFFDPAISAQQPMIALLGAVFCMLTGGVFFLFGKNDFQKDKGKLFMILAVFTSLLGTYMALILPILIVLTLLKKYANERQ